ncbi:MAG: transposase [Gammaproteobacteria bacterium]|nr:transposase [Gammaproteobacteria bacterium]
MTRYSAEFKEQMVRKMMPPTNQSVASIHRETGISTPSLYAWKRLFQSRGYVVPEPPRESRRLLSLSQAAIAA